MCPFRVGCRSGGSGTPMINGQPMVPVHPVVIVVDDDAAVFGSLKFALEIEGFAVRAYSTGDAVFNDSGLADCACFIIDQKLPGLTGLEVVAALRERKIGAPAILITSHPTIVLRGDLPRPARLALAARCRGTAGGGRVRRGGGAPIVEKPLLSNALLE